MVKYNEYNQGDIIRIEGIKDKVVIVSKNVFNQFGLVFGCPIYTHGESGPLHIYINTKETEGYVHCEKLKLLDLKERGSICLDRIPINAIVDITDAIQGIFDYI